MKRKRSAASGEDRGGWEADADEEQIALSRHSELRAHLERSRQSARLNGTIPMEEMRAFRDLTPEEDAGGERLLAELERQTEEEEAAREAARQPNGAATGAAEPTRTAGTRTG